MSCEFSQSSHTPGLVFREGPHDTLTELTAERQPFNPRTPPRRIPHFRFLGTWVEGDRARRARWGWHERFAVSTGQPFFIFPGRPPTPSQSFQFIRESKLNKPDHISLLSAGVPLIN